MTSQCAVVESIALAITLTVPNIMVQAQSLALSTSGVHIQATANCVANATASTSVVQTAYSRLVSNAQPVDAVTAKTICNNQAESAAVSTSNTLAILSNKVVSNGVSTDSVAVFPYSRVSSTATASDRASVQTSSKVLVLSAGGSVSDVAPATTSLLASNATTTSAVNFSVKPTVLLSSNALATSATYVIAPTKDAVVSSGTAISDVTTRLTAFTYVDSVAAAASHVWYADPSMCAFVMNTESTAMSLYDNFASLGSTFHNGVLYTVLPDGIYAHVGSTDGGAAINAKVETGFVDFGVEQQKRVDTIWFGYTSSGTLKTTVETYESHHPPFVYNLEQRTADAPRNSRITPGKGMFGRYWRFTIGNVAGADFKVASASLELAVSNRRL